VSALVHVPVWQWWNAPEGDASISDVVNALYEQIVKGRDARLNMLVAMRAVYLDIACDHYATEGFYRNKRSRYNLMQGAVDSTHAQIVASRPRPKVVTVAADDSATRRAELRQRWIDGEYERLGCYEKLSEMVLDGLIYGTGVLKVGSEDGRPVVDKVWCGDLWVDPREERYGRVRTLYQMHALDRDIATLEFPKHANMIYGLPPLDMKENQFSDLAMDGGYEARNQVGIIEAWRLPTTSKPRSIVSSDERVVTGAGRHVVVCSGGVLVDEPWDHHAFPFVVFRWGTDPQRWWGQGMVERGAGMQADLNALTEVIQNAYEVMVPQFWVDDNAGAQGINNVVGRVNRCKTNGLDIRTMVQVLSPDVGPGLLSREAEIAQRFLHVLGVDALQAKAEKPAGLNSGAALQNYKDSVSSRFLPQGRRYEQTTVDLANLLFYFADKLTADGHEQSVRVYGRTIGLEIIRYDDIRPQGDEVFDVRVQPASALPKDIPGRIQALYDLQALGLQLDPARMAELIEMPDIEGLTDEMNAPRMIVEDAIRRCFIDDEPQPQANAFWPQPMALTMLTNSIQLGMIKGAPTFALDRMMNLHTFVRDMGKPPPADPNAAPMPLPPAAAGAPMMGAPIGAVPGQPPAAPPPEAMGPPPPMM
jgi:hypothetical protein